MHKRAKTRPFPGRGCDLAGAVRRSYLGGTGKCFDGRRLWEQLEPSAKPFRDSYRGEPPNSRGMDACQAGNDRNLQKNPEIEIKSRFLTQNIANLKKKLGGTKMSKNFFAIFGFVPYVDQIKVISF